MEPCDIWVNEREKQWAEEEKLEAVMNLEEAIDKLEDSNYYYKNKILEDTLITLRTFYNRVRPMDEDDVID